MKSKINRSEKKWKQILSPEKFHILREKGTEPPFTGEYLDNKKKGTYLCAGCGNELFSSNKKFNSNTGWPSFLAPISEDSVELKEDSSIEMRRTEVMCNKCGGHLGHVFKDGPKPSGLRFCINSMALEFKEK
jgi:peptide-methionine (R)-S-oxide reductase